jgi:hypothetical protein
VSLDPSGAGDASRELGAALAEELRAVLRAVNEQHIDDDRLADALAQARRLREVLDGPRRPRWYEVGLIDGRSTNDTRNRFGDHSLFRGELNAIAPPLRYGVVERDGRRIVEGTVRCSLLYEGPPGGVHGGYVAGLFDDILGGSQQLLDGPSGLTGVLTVRYRKLTPLETDLRLVAWIDHVAGRRIHAKATCHAGDDLTAEAEALFVRVDMGEVAAQAQRARDH